MKILLIYFFLLFSLHADEALSELFKQLETVSKEDKFKVVNSIKKHVIALKQQERVEAIKLLKEKKELEAKSVLQEEIVEVMSNETTPDNPSSMENHEPKISEMNTPQMAANMEQMQNIGTMSQMPLMQEIKDKKKIGEMRDFSMIISNGMKGNR